MIKRKNFIVILFAFTLILLSAVIACSLKNTSARADSIQPIYSHIMFDYKSFTGKSIEECNTIVEREGNVLKTKPIKQSSNSEEHELSISFEGDEYAPIDKGGVYYGYIGKELIEIQFMKGFETNSVKIQDISGKVVNTFDSDVINVALSDGYYTVTYTGCSEWVENNESKAVKVIALFKFIVDTKAPEVQLLDSDENNHIAVTWVGDDYIAFLNGNTYNKGEYIAQEGINIVEVRKIYGPSTIKEINIGHFYVTQKFESTCLENGFTLHHCVNCGDDYKDEFIPLLEHNYEVEEIVDPTCAENGYITYRCTDCDTIYTETQPALGHDYSIIEYPPSCTEHGKNHYTCQKCGHEHDEQNGAYPTGHDYTCAIIVPATCTQEGIRRYTCDACGDTFDVHIDAIVHDYVVTDTKLDNGNILRIYVCAMCGDTYEQEISNNYEEVVEFIEHLIDKYTISLVWVFLITAGIWSIAIGVTIIIAHKNEDKEKAKKMLINYCIGLVVISVILLACPLLLRGIASLIT